ncbi:hypothetical protein mRhiFer1_008779 [Rhinolophus ferrumequinum]|uniref:Uncharacterized protein n=1 Tax=Rhinolophus ferrumequinum TaxID=59479 RepID=A0A7J7TME5_RHIFE|nr:hypothetical protein mRhiFer1_008779 [Rhinolophus ferrumequinum]
MAKSWVRTVSTSLWTLPALPAPPDDALLPPLFVVSVPLRAFARFSPGAWGRWELREAEGRPERTDRSSSPPSSGSRSSAHGCDLGTRAAPLRPASSPHSGLPPSQWHFEQPGQRRRETDRQSDLPLFPPPQLRSAHTKEEEETRELRRWFSCPGLDSSCVGAERGSYGPKGRGDSGPRRGTPGCWGGRRGARGEHGCRAQCRSKGLKATGSGAWGKVVGLRMPSQTKEQ